MAHGRVCIPVFNCKMLKEAARKTSVIEVRLDRFGKGEREKLPAVAERLKAKIILTIRKRSEGGKFKESERERKELFFRMLEIVAFVYVDVELSSGKEFIEAVKKEAGKRKTKLILSRHYFKGTPGKKEFLRTYAKMKRMGADVCKIVGTARDESDCRNAMEALRRVRKSTALFFCMGEKGKNTRVECLKFGAPFTYASLKKGKESASGQMSVGEMKKLLEE